MLDDDDIPPDMPELDDQLLDELGLDVEDLADAGPPPPLVPPPAPPPANAPPPAPVLRTTTRTGASISTPVGRFTITRRLAAGGMGEVFLARKLGSASFNKDVALKRIVTALRLDDEARKMFVDEARLAAHLSHPNIATVFDLVELQNSYLLVMEFIPGDSLKELLTQAQLRRANFSEGFALYVVAEAASALAYAHELTVDGRHLGIVHRDVSPHNLMVTTSGTVKLLDFGVAFSHLEGRDKTRTGIVKGKVSYMSPEQATGDSDVDGRSDQFALAIVAVELLTGRRLFDAKSETSTLLRIANCRPELIADALSGLPAELAEILGRALQKAPDARWPTCLAFGEALRDYLLARQLRFGPTQALAEITRLRALPEDAGAVMLPPLATSPAAPPASAAPAPAAPAAVPAPAAPAVASPPPPASAPKPAAAVVAPAVVAPEPASAHSLPAAPAAPGATTLLRKKKTEEALYSPPQARRSGVVVPVVGFALVAVVAVGAIRLLTSGASSEPATVEEVKTASQQRAEKELAEQQLHAQAVTTPPTLTQAPPPTPPQDQAAPVTVAAPPPTQPAPATSAGASRPRKREAPAAAPPPQPTPAAPVVAAPTAAPLRDLRFRTGGASSTAPSAASDTGVGLARGTQLKARLDALVDPSAPGPLTVTVSHPLVVDGRTVVAQGARVVCEVGGLQGTRLAVSCDSLAIDGRPRAIQALLYGSDGRPGLPVALTGGGQSNTASAAVSTGERVTRSLRPSGVVGDLVDGVTDAVGSSARQAAAPGGSTANPVPKGTAVVVWLTQAL